MPKNINILREVFADDPAMLSILETREQNALLREMVSKSSKEVSFPGVEMIKGEKGDKGDKGDQGEKGSQGEKGDQGEKGEPGKDGANGKKGEKGEAGRDGVNGKKGEKGEAGKDAVFESETLLGDLVKQIKKKKLIERRDIKDMPLDQRWHGGGIQNITGYIQAGTNVTLAGSGTLTDPYVVSATGGAGSYSIIQKTTGTIDDSNTVFGFAQLPTELVINGASYIQAGGSYTWTWNAGTLEATLSLPVGSGGSLYARV